MASRSLYNLISANRWKTFGFILLFTVLIAAIGVGIIMFFQYWYEIYSITPFILLGLFIVGYNLIFFFASAKLALVANGAKKADPVQYKRLHNVVEEMAIASGLPKPEVYVVDDPSPNAFATGRNPKNAAIAVTTGLYGMVDRAELQGVIAHEMSHIKNYDILLMTIVAIMIGLVVLMRDIFWRWGFFMGRGRRRSSGKGSGYLALIWLAIGLVLAILAPLAVMLIRAAISRQREYLADASGAMMTRHPEGLARALEKIGTSHTKMQRRSSSTAHLFISSPVCKDRPNPKKAHQKVKVNLFSTHPPIELRVQRLRGMSLDGEYAQQLAWARDANAGSAGLVSTTSAGFVSGSSAEASSNTSGSITIQTDGKSDSDYGGPPTANQSRPQTGPPGDEDQENFLEEYLSKDE